MSNVPKPGAVPVQRAGIPQTPWFTGDVPALAARLRDAAVSRTDGDCVQAVIYIEAIQEHPRLSTPARARLTAAVLSALQQTRGWDAPLAVPGELPGAMLDPADRPAGENPPDGEVAAIATELRAHTADRPAGDCVQALLYIEAIHDADIPAAEKCQRTMAVIAAVRRLRDWVPVDEHVTRLPSGRPARPEAGS
jgi:hypothetical protein